jgi:hypothetical protein
MEKNDFEKRVARLTWNNNGWVKPSGRRCKSTTGGLHEAIHGYGHEEWLFDKSKLVGEFHYGFLEPIRKHQGTYANKTFDVLLYSINGITKKRYYVGNIQKLMVIGTREAKEIKGIYEKNGWIKEMEEQIKMSVADQNGFSDWKRLLLFNVKFKFNDCIINNSLIELPKTHFIYDRNRYNFYTHPSPTSGRGL